VDASSVESLRKDGTKQAWHVMDSDFDGHSNGCGDIALEGDLVRPRFSLDIDDVIA
jgi:hypothetical protein